MYDFGTACRPHDAGISPTERQTGYHNRSTSGTSQFSIATAGSGQRTGSFVHPFQQMPRPHTPPITVVYQDPARSTESPINVSDDESEIRTHHYYHSSIPKSHRSHSLAAASPSIIPPPLIHTKHSLSHIAVAGSYSSLQNQIKCNEISSISDSISQSSVGTSMEKGFRLRSRSEVITRSRAQSIQEARRKFLEKEIAEDEKAAREEIKRLQKRQQKEAIKIDRFQRQSSVSDPSRSRRSISDLKHHVEDDDSTIQADDAGQLQQPFIPEHIPESRNNVSNAKQRTYSAWTKFVIWLRIRLMRTSSNRLSKR
ncbi:hypothetical protein K3495_g11912 [Podosphaera aphanis]|nr:hypothetical protein K3495_g11912 [Podosphaera aphanis]